MSEVSNPVIDRMRERLANLSEPEGDTVPLDAGEDAGAGAPPAAPPQGVPGQEPPAGMAPGAPPAAPDAGATPPPVAGTAEFEALKQQNIVLTQQAQEFQTLYQRQHGMVAPLQRKTAEQDQRIKDLTQQVEDLRQGNPGAGSPPQPQATPPAQPGAEDLTLKEFNEMYGDMVPGLRALVQQIVGTTVQPQLQELQPAIDLAAETQRKRVLNTHLALLYAKYPNVAGMIGSPQFEQWVAKKPSYAAQSIYEKVMSPENYPVDQIISIFDEFSLETQAPPAPPAPPAAPSPGEMVVDVRRVPTSSTPGGTPLPQPLTRERLTQINRALTVDRALWTDDEVAALKAELSQGEAVANATGFGLAPRLDTLSRR